MTQPETTSRSNGTVAYLISNLIEGGFALLFSIVLVRLISQHEFGSWRQFLIVFGLVSNILIFGLPKSLLYFYSVSARAERARVALRSLLLAGGLGIVAACIYLLARDWIASAWSNPGLSTHALLFALYLLLYFPLLVFQSLMIAADRRYQLSLWKGGFATSKLLVLVYLLLTDGTLLNLLVAINLHTLIQLIISLPIYVKISGLGIKGVFSDAGSQMRYSFHVMLQSLSIVVGREMDKILVSLNATPERFAAYSVGARELPVIDLFPYAVGDAITPELSKLFLERKYSEFLELWHRWMKRVAVLMYPLFALIVFKHNEIITLLYTSDYIEGAIPFLIVGCLIPLRLTTYNQTLLAMNQSKAVVIGSAAGLVLTTVLGYIGIKTLGLAGAALGLMIAEYLANSYYCSRIGRELHTRINQLFPWRFLFKTLGLSLATGAIAKLFDPLIAGLSVFANLLVFGMVFGILYVLGVRALGLITVEDLRRMRSTFTKR